MAIAVNITEKTTDKEIHGFIDELTYICYRYNRLRTPDITPEGWKCIFPNADTMERRLQKEANNGTN